jgi:hypothetical protein
VHPPAGQKMHFDEVKKGYDLPFVGSEPPRSLGSRRPADGARA